MASRGSGCDSRLMPARRGAESNVVVFSFIYCVSAMAMTCQTLVSILYPAARKLRRQKKSQRNFRHEFQNKSNPPGQGQIDRVPERLVVGSCRRPPHTFPLVSRFPSILVLLRWDWKMDLPSCLQAGGQWRGRVRFSQALAFGQVRGEQEPFVLVS